MVSNYPKGDWNCGFVHTHTLKWNIMRFIILHFFKYTCDIYIHVIYTCEIMFIYVIYIHVTLPGVSLHFQISLFYNVLHLCSFNDSSSLRWTWPMRRESMQSWLPRPHSMTTWRRPRRFMGFRTFIAQAGDSLSLPQHIYNMLWEYIRIWKKHY